MQSDKAALPRIARWGWSALAGCIALGALAGIAAAQSPTQPSPAPVTSVDGSSTIASTNTFQSVFAAQGPGAGSFNTTTGAVTTGALRRGCLIINTSNSVQYVFFGAIASATTPKSVPLNAASADGSTGGSVSCERNDIGTLQDQVSITGTAGETFFAIRY